MSALDMRWLCWRMRFACMHLFCCAQVLQVLHMGRESHKPLIPAMLLILGLMREQLHPRPLQFQPPQKLRPLLLLLLQAQTI